jgi:hypothetical protein
MYCGGKEEGLVNFEEEKAGRRKVVNGCTTLPLPPILSLPPFSINQLTLHPSEPTGKYLDVPVHK